MNNEKLQRLVKISQLHYYQHLSQSQIADELHLSRPTVANALKTALKEGIIQIKINDPLADAQTLSEQLADKFNLRKVILCQPGQTEDLLENLGQAGAQYLQSIISDQQVVGLSWGETMTAVAQHLEPAHRQNLQFVSLKGIVSNSAQTSFAGQIAAAFNQAYQLQTQLWPVPVIFQKAATLKAVMQDGFIARLSQISSQAEIVMYTVGTVRRQAMMFNLDYFNEQEIAELQSKAVGDVNAHFIKADGSLADEELDQRTAAVSLANLKRAPYSILIAGGQEKFLPIKAALTAGYPNVLITDTETAKALLENK
ncbi:MAG: sugar-binding transcriptional regulator [Lactobacillus sp.]|jgi:deoxyribonucleoside regulator|nr:sugar-binding transcriptional regulator [Lactobacillus sp.]